jgi:hypothetical protein
MPSLHLDLPFAVAPAVQCDIRRGRPPQPGDEVWRASGLGSDWSAAEAAARG